MTHFLPEGRLIGTPENTEACATIPGLNRAKETHMILEGMVLMCSAEHDLIVQVGPFLGQIPRLEAALGIAEGTTREIAILSRVGKPVSFTVESVTGTVDDLHLMLSRRHAQQMAQDALLNRLKPGMVIPATVTHLEPFGAFVDIGCGLASMIGIEHISISRIPDPGCRFTVGQNIFAVVLAVDSNRRRVHLTHRELLGTWSENAAQLTPGMTVSGIIRGIKEYGIFVELFPNLSGLAENRPGLQEGDRVSVYLKSLNPEQMKVKLLIIERLPPDPSPPHWRYYVTGGRLSHWHYAPDGCLKPGLETDFTDQSL
ncbi:MAG: S1 RNA-binding domain-containing protein [Intestinimonas sp.]|nr:S1 RNA-binding domain-containing protein [Intestinimonas sp.]